MKVSLSPSDSLRRLEPRERRVVGGGAIASAVLMVAIWVILPFAQHWSRRDARLAAARERWEHLTKLVASTDSLRAVLAAARQISATDADQLVSGPTPALAASTLQELVQRDAGQSAVQLERVDAAGEPHPDKPGLLAIPVQLQARGDVYGLVDFLVRLASSDPLLIVDELTIDAESDEENDGRASPTAAVPPQVLTWTLRLHGLYEGEGPRSP